MFECTQLGHCCIIDIILCVLNVGDTLSTKCMWPLLFVSSHMRVCFLSPLGVAEYSYDLIQKESPHNELSYGHTKVVVMFPVNM